MPRATSASAVYDDEGNDVLRFEESDDFSSYPNSNAHDRADAAPQPGHEVDLKRKQAELLQLRQELESKERETNQLEQRRQKEDRFTKGRRNMCEQLSRTLVRLERELENSQKAIDEMTVARDTFERHLAILRDQQPETWQRHNMDAELDLALGSVEDAEEEFARISRRLSTVALGGHSQSSNHQEGPGRGLLNLPDDFQACLRLGFAFTLPMAGVLALTMIFIKILSH